MQQQQGQLEWENRVRLFVRPFDAFKSQQQQQWTEAVHFYINKTSRAVD